jgi:hypothetical protein
LLHRCSQYLLAGLQHFSGTGLNMSVEPELHFRISPRENKP